METIIEGITGSMFTTDGGMYVLYGYSRGKDVTEEVIPEQVGEIASGVFGGNTELTSVQFPPSMFRIGSDAFQGCTGLTQLKLPQSVAIGGGAFADCAGLTLVELSQDSTVAGGAFAGCFNLREFRIRKDVYSFDSMLRAQGPALFSETTLLSVPSASGEYLVPEGTEKIAAKTFARCPGLTRVIVPDSVVSIGEEAFAECPDLEQVVLPAGLKSLAKGLFRGCGKLKTVNIPPEVKKIGDRAFEGCRALEAAALPPKLGEIGAGAFRGCARLKLEPNLPSSLKTLGDRAFDGCQALTKLILSAKNKADLGNEVFFGCAALAEVRALSRQVALRPKTCENWSGALAAPNLAVEQAPAGCKQSLSLGFALLELEERQKEASESAKKVKKKPEGVPEEIRAGYLKYIKGQRKRLYPAALQQEQLLQLMMAEKMIPQKELQPLLELADQQQNIAAKAAILEYARRNFKPADLDKEFKL